MAIDMLSHPFGRLASSNGIGAAGITQPTAFANAETIAQLPANVAIPIAEDSQAPVGTVVMDYAQFAEFEKQPFAYTYLIVLPNQPMRQVKMEHLARSLSVQEPASTGDLNQLTDSFHLNLTAFGPLAFAVGIFIVYGAIGLAFEQRRPMIRTLRALGVPLRTIVTTLCIEMGFFAVLSGAFGVATVLLPGVSATLQGLYGAEVSGTLSLRPRRWASGMGIAILGTGIAAASALTKVARMPLLASATNRSWTIGSDRSLAQVAGAGAALWVVAGLALAFGSGLIAGFVVLGAFLMGAAFLLPMVLRLIIGLMKTLSTNVTPQWFWSDTGQQVPGLSMALMALMLAMAKNVGVSTMVSSFRLTFVGWLDQRLTSEIYVRFDTEPDAKGFEENLKDRPVTVLPIVSKTESIHGQNIEILGVIDHATYRENWVMLDAIPKIWDVLGCYRPR